MLLVAITPEKSDFNESARICNILDSGFDYVHIRKPSWAADDVSRYLDSIPIRYYNRLAVHNFFEIADERGLGGIHLNRRRPSGIPSWNGRTSRSCHSLEDVANLTVENYAFLSPIFDSISKAGYRSGFSEEQLRKACAIQSDRLVALGGMTSVRIPIVRDLGFSGCAFLGYLFSADEEAFQARLKSIVQQNDNK